MKPWFGLLVEWRSEEVSQIPKDIRFRVKHTWNFVDRGSYLKHALHGPNGLEVLKMTEHPIKIWEDLSNLYFEGVMTKDQAVEIAIKRHLRYPDRWHEVHRYEKYFGRYIGFAQWKPGDCEHHAPREECSICKTICPECGSSYWIENRHNGTRFCRSCGFNPMARSQ